MATTSRLRKTLDRKQWEMCTVAPSSAAAGSFITSSTLSDNLQLYCNGVSLFYLYEPDEDGWIFLPASGLAGTFGAGSCGAYHPAGPAGTATAGSSTTLTTNLTIPGSLAGYVVRITGGTGVGQERTITSNTYGANSVLTFSSAWTTAPSATSTYTIFSGRFWVFIGNNASSQGFRYYDVATNTWSAALSTTNIPLSFATDGKLRATPGMNGPQITGTATSATSTTLVNSAKAWTTNQFANFQVRITGGTGVGQVRTIASNTGTTLTVSSAWTTTPDATSTYVIEGSDDFIYLIGNNAVTLYRYSISGNTWTVMSPAVARAAAPGAGMSWMWVRSVSDASWNNESNLLNGRRIYSFRGGGSAGLDYYDIPSNSWVSLTYQRANETFTTGTSWDNAGNGVFYCQKDATGRFFRYSALTNTLDAWGTLLYTQGTAIVGDRLFTVDYVDGATTLTWVYQLRNSGVELFRCLVI